jgi:hypothetical protein
MANVLMAGIPAMMMTQRHLAERGWTSPLARHPRYSGEFLPCVVAYLGLILHCDANLYPLFSLGLLF